MGYRLAATYDHLNNRGDGSLTALSVGAAAYMGEANE